MGVLLSKALHDKYISSNLIDINYFYHESHGNDYRNAFISLIAYCKDNKKVAYFPRGEYYMSGTFIIDYSISIFADNAVIISDIVSGTFILITGAEGVYQPITETTEFNFIKTTLAGSLAPNDLVKIRSDEPFTDLVYYNEPCGKGEMSIVRNVDNVNNVVFLHSALNDVYSIENWDDERETPSISTLSNVRIAKITPVTPSITGKLTIKNNTTDYNTNGLRHLAVSLVFCRDIDIDINIINFSQMCLSIKNCYGGKVNGNIIGAARDSSQTGDGAPGYGIEIVGTTMNMFVTGTISGCRHAVVHNCYQGVAWNNTISITGYGSRSNAIIDSHSPCGSMIVDGCNLIGGKMVSINDSLDPLYSISSGIKRRSYGISYGARTTVIRNCYFKNLVYAVIPREICDVESCVIENIKLENVFIGVHLMDRLLPSGSIKSLNINNVTATNCFTILNYYHGMYSGSSIAINNIKTDGKLLTILEGSGSNDEKISFICNNVECSGLNDITGLNDIILVGSNTSFTKDIIINNINCSGYIVFIKLNEMTYVENIKINNCTGRLTSFIKFTGTSANDRLNLLSVLNAHIETTDLILVDSAVANQSIKNIIYDNLYAKGATSFTNLISTNIKDGNIIFDN